MQYIDNLQQFEDSSSTLYGYNAFVVAEEDS